MAAFDRRMLLDDFLYRYPGTGNTAPWLFIHNAVVGGLRRVRQDGAQTFR